jgi:ABC-2 type transport system permease protein
MIALLRFEITRTLRNARFLVMLIAFPVALYLIYGTQQGIAQNLTIGALVLVSMAVYSGMGSAMFATGPQLARERQSGWMRQLRVSPISTPAWFGVKLAQGILMIIPGLTVLVIVAVATGHVHLTAVHMLVLVGVLLAGAIPFCMLGMVIGLMFDGQTAQIAQMITLIALAFLGGIFIPWNNLPGGAQLPPGTARLGLRGRFRPARQRRHRAGGLGDRPGRARHAALASGSQRHRLRPACGRRRRLLPPATVEA